MTSPHQTDAPYRHHRRHLYQLRADALEALSDGFSGRLGREYPVASVQWKADLNPVPEGEGTHGKSDEFALTLTHEAPDGYDADQVNIVWRVLVDAGYYEIRQVNNTLNALTCPAQP